MSVHPQSHISCTGFPCPYFQNVNLTPLDSGSVGVFVFACVFKCMFVCACACMYVLSRHFLSAGMKIHTTLLGVFT